MSDDDVVELVVRLPPELHEAIKKRAKVEDRSMAAVIRVALRQYLKLPDVGTLSAAAWYVLGRWEDCTPPADLANYMAEGFQRLSDALRTEP